MVFSISALMLGAALMSAQAQPPPPAQPPVAAQAPPDKAPPEKTQRPTERTQRPSTRQPSASGQGSFEEARNSRDGGPSRQELTFTANVLAGYDDNLTAGLGSGSGTSPAAMVSGTTASVDGTLGYFRGNSLRSFQFDTTGSLIGYPDNLENPAPAGSLNASGRTPMGRATTFGLSAGVSYEPLFSVLSPGAGTGPLPPGRGAARANHRPLRTEFVEFEHGRLARPQMGTERHDHVGLHLPDAGIHGRRLRRQHLARRDGGLQADRVVAREGWRGLPLPETASMPTRRTSFARPSSNGWRA